MFGVSPQSTALGFEEVTEDTVYTCTGQPLPTDIAMIVEWMLNESYMVAYQSKLATESWPSLPPSLCLLCPFP